MSNHDLRGTPASSQIIWFEKRCEEQANRIIELEKVLEEVLNSDMAIFAEDDGRYSPELVMIREVLKKQQ